MIILQAPQEINFSGMLPELIIETESKIDILLSSAGETIIEESYVPSETGRVRIDLRKPVEENLEFIIPSTDIFIQPKIMKTFSVKITEGVTETTIEFAAIRGGVKTLSITSELWLKSNFLTWQSQEKRVEWDTPEWLTYYAEENCDLKITAYFTEDAPTVLEIASFTAGKVYSINMQFGRIDAMFINKQTVYFDVAVWQGSTRLSYTQRYILKETTDDSEIYFFENSLGGMDSVTFNGAVATNPEYEENTALFDDTESGYYIDRKDIYTQQTGYVSRYESLWLQDLFGSLRKYNIDSGNITPIIITEIRSDIESDNDFISLEFKYKPARDTLFLTLERNYDKLPDVLEIIAPDEQLFFLAPRLIEFPDIDINDNMLFPVQSSFEGKWYRLSLGDLKRNIEAESGGSITTVRWVDITGKPVAYPAETHFHIIANVTGLQAVLDGKASVVHYHTVVDITDFPTSLPASDVYAWAKAPEKPAYLWEELTGKPTEFNPAAHFHIIANVTGLQAVLDGKASVVHYHTVVDITDFPTSLPASDVYAWAKAPAKPAYLWEELTGKPTEFNPAAHFHIIANVTGLQAVLDGKASVVHYHTVVDITDFPTSLPASDVYAWAKAPAKPAYSWPEITGKPLDFFIYQGYANPTYIDNDYLSWGNPNFTNYNTGIYAIDRDKYTDMYIKFKGVGSTSGLELMTHYSYGADIFFRKIIDSNRHAGGWVKFWTSINFNPANYLSLTDVYAWAKAGVKPAYSWGEITGKPTEFNPAAHFHIIANVTGLQAALDGKAPVVHKHKIVDITDFPTSLPASDVYAWAKAPAKPAYSWGEITGKPLDFFIYQGYANLTYIDNDYLSWGNPNFINYNTGIYAIDRNTYTDMYIKFKGVGSTSGLELMTHYSYGEDIFFRKIIDSNRHAGGWVKFWTSVNFNPANYLSSTDVYAWAKAPAKPVYSWGEITGKPTEISEEISWTPTTSSDITIVENYCSYIKENKKITLFFFAIFRSKSSNIGTIFLGGLPYAPKHNRYIVPVYVGGIKDDAVIPINVQVLSSGLIFFADKSDFPLSTSELKEEFMIMFQLMYIIN